MSRSRIPNPTVVVLSTLRRRPGASVVEISSATGCGLVESTEALSWLIRNGYATKKTKGRVVRFYPR